MSHRLSISAAAKECPDRVALVVGSEQFTYAQLAAQCETVTLPEHNVHRADDAMHTALLLYASLERQLPLALLPRGIGEEQFQNLARRVPSGLAPALALLLFTSGSSGVAKGVKLSRRALLASAVASADRLGWQQGDRWLCCLPLSHIGGLSILLRCLVDRKTVVLCEHFDAQAIAEQLGRESITHISLVPTMLWRLLEEGGRAPGCLRVTLIGGAGIDPSTVQRARDAGYPLFLSYGSTETASQIITDGRPLAGVGVRLQGERLAIAGDMLMDGYLPPHDQRPGLHDGWLQTEDLAEIDSRGRVRILGRADDTIISGGENINPRDIESALCAVPAIRASFALGLPDQEWGQVLVALVVVGQQVGDVTDQELEALIPQELRAHRKPKALIAVSELPLLANGKVDRNQARAIAERWQREARVRP